MLDRYDESELLELIEGGLDARRVEALSRELEADPAGAALIERMRRDRAMLKSLDEPEVPPDLMQALEPLLARPMLLEPPLARKIVKTPRTRRQLWPRAAAIAALFALALLAGVWAATMGLPWRADDVSSDRFAMRDESRRTDDASTGRVQPGSDDAFSSNLSEHETNPAKAPDARSRAATADWPPVDAEIHHHEADLKRADVTMARSAAPAAPRASGKGGTAASTATTIPGRGGGLGQTLTQDKAPLQTAAQTAEGLTRDAAPGEQHAQGQVLVLEDSQLTQPAAEQNESRQFIAADFAIVLPTADEAAAEFAVCNAVNDLAGHASFVRNFTYDEALELEKQVQTQQQTHSRLAVASGVGGLRRQVAAAKDLAQEPVTQERLDELAMNCQRQADQAPSGSTTAKTKVNDKSVVTMSTQLAGPAELMTPYVNQLQFSLQGASHTIAVPAPLLEQVLEKLSSQAGQETVLRSMRPEACTTDVQPVLPPAWVWLRDRQMVIESIQRLAQRSTNDVVLVPVVVEAADAARGAASTPAAAAGASMQPAEQQPAAEQPEKP